MVILGVLQKNVLHVQIAMDEVLRTKYREVHDLAARRHFILSVYHARSKFEYVNLVEMELNVRVCCRGTDVQITLRHLRLGTRRVS